MKRKVTREKEGDALENIVAQVIGFLAVITFIISYQIKSNRIFFVLQVLGSALFCIQFFLLGAAGGCLSLGVNILRSALLVKYNDWAWVRWKGLPWIFCGVYGLILAFTWAGALSILPLFASVVSTLGYWRNNAKAIRVSNLCASPCWFIYDVCVRSWGGALNEIITVGSILVSVVRFGWKALGDPESEFQK